MKVINPSKEGWTNVWMCGWWDGGMVNTASIFPAKYKCKHMRSHTHTYTHSTPALN